MSQRLELELFRPQGKAGYALETRSFPIIDVSASGAMIPRLLASRSSTQAAPATLALSVPNLALHYRGQLSPGQRNVLQQRAQFTLQPEMLFEEGIRDLRAGEGCFRSLQDNGGQADFSVRCDSSHRFSGARLQQQIESTRRALSSPGDMPDEVSQYAFIVLDIRGSANVSGTVGGAVELRISQPGGISRSLGGRRFTGSGESNFVPRGAPAGNYSAQFRARYADEIQAHQAIMVKLGVPVELEFSLVPDSANAGLLEWKAASIRVFAPHYRSMLTAVECEDLSSRARYDELRASVCQKSRHPAGMPRGDSVVLPGKAEKVLTESVCLSDATAPQILLEQRGITEASNYHTVGPPVAGVCASVEGQRTCPENYGHARLTLPEGAGSAVVCDSPEARLLCPPPETSVVQQDRSACWTIRARDVPLNGELRWTQSDCRQRDPLLTQLPAAVQSFAALRITSHRLLDHEQRLYTGEVRPSDLIGQEERYRCAEISPRSVEIGDDLTQLKPDSLFRSRGALGADYREKLFLDAQQNFIDPARNLDPRAWFEAREQVESVLVDSPPVDSSLVYWLEENRSPDWTLLAHRVRGEALPAACANKGTVCRREQVDVVHSYPDNAHRDLLPDRGEELGYQAVSAAMPGLARECGPGSKACVELSLEEESDAQGKLFVARGELRVPLILSPVPFVISRVARGRWERELVNR